MMCQEFHAERGFRGAREASEEFVLESRTLASESVETGPRRRIDPDVCPENSGLGRNLAPCVAYLRQSADDPRIIVLPFHRGRVRRCATKYARQKFERQAADGGEESAVDLDLRVDGVAQGARLHLRFRLLQVAQLLGEDHGVLSRRRVCAPVRLHVSALRGALEQILDRGHDGSGQARICPTRHVTAARHVRSADAAASSKLSPATI